ncbi:MULTISPECIES: hypothetical protein [unclassified Pseudomonas]|uniref:hypothetical protein n=1 Tax=unclassified Pseudomonas TaxID=196821 RepID=UPI00384D8ABD
MQVVPHAVTQHFFAPLFLIEDEQDRHFGGDQSPLNDSDADEETDPGELDLADLGLDEFADADKLDIGSATLG